ncbi:MAG: GerMN domain-containing protein, partial [Christensenellaceae bacterium]|nr:GerMN domain-containing protein [Christensenellaceae bacterium]
LSTYIPAGTTIQSIDIREDGLCTVDFSKELQTAELNSTEEKFVIESILNTLSQFDSVSAVQIRVNGNVVESIAGHWDISKPLTLSE